MLLWPANFYLFTLISFGAQDGTSSQKSQFNFEELNVERLVLSLAQMKHASPLSQKFDLFLGCSIPPPPRPLLKQVFDWATGGVVEISLD